VRWKSFASFCSKFIHEIVYQISFASPELRRIYYKKSFGFFSGHSVHLAYLVLDSYMYNIGSFVQKYAWVLLHLLYRLEIGLPRCLYISDSTHVDDYCLGT